MSDTIPGLRLDLEYIPFEQEGRPLVLVRDPLGLAPEGRALPMGLFQIMARMDGRTAVSDLLSSLASSQEWSEPPDADDIRAMVGELDKAYMLNTERYRAARDRVVEAYAAEPLRRAALAGQAYPDEPEALRAFLDQCLARAGEGADSDGGVRALIAPHIDPQAGKAVYGHAYAALKGAEPERVVVLGVGHQMVDGLYSLTRKRFATPLGEIDCDVDAVDALVRAGGRCVADNDFVHRAEHSIEFQAVFLRHVLGRGFSIVPILCGSFHGALREYGRAAFREACPGFLEALAEVAARPRTLVVAGVDFCHIGLKFGHKDPAKAMEERAREHDMSLIRRLLSGDADGFWAESASVRDGYNVCGFSALATLMEILPGAQGSLLDYGMWHEPPTSSAVGFAAAVLDE